jgi:hypothetical protein
LFSSYLDIPQGNSLMKVSQIKFSAKRSESKMNPCLCYKAATCIVVVILCVGLSQAISYLEDLTLKGNEKTVLDKVRFKVFTHKNTIK